MGFWDRDVENGFDAMFDLNHDGELNSAEQAMEYAEIDHLITGKYSWESSNEDSEVDRDLEEHEEIQDEIDGMDEEEAREYLESEGYDPDDFDL